MSRHRLVSFLITAAALVLLANAVRRVLSDDGQVNAVTWVAVALMATASITVSFWQRRAPQEVRFFMAWFAGISPALLGIAAALTGSLAIVMWIGVLLALGLIGWIALRPA